MVPPSAWTASVTRRHAATCSAVIPALAYFFFGLNEIAAFWFAYILTRPIGASFADWTGRASNAGGIGIGTERVSLVLAVLIIGFVGYLTITRKDTQSA